MARFHRAIRRGYLNFTRSPFLMSGLGVGIGPEAGSGLLLESGSLLLLETGDFFLLEG